MMSDLSYIDGGANMGLETRAYLGGIALRAQLIDKLFPANCKL